MENTVFPNGERCFFPEDLWTDVKISTATFHWILNTVFSHKGHIEISNTPGSPNFTAKKSKMCQGYFIPFIGWMIDLFNLFWFFGEG